MSHHEDRPVRTLCRAVVYLSWVVLCIGTILCLGTLMPPRVLASDLRWPLDANPLLTSSFGEFRASHIHAGIDLATGGRKGLKCYAVESGYVARLRMSPYGYGKALYIQLDSGPLVVYAHLESFSNKIMQRAIREQTKRRQYTFDIYLKPDEIRVVRGEVVARSGDTGVGFPHLHFEMRDGDVARNPQTAGLELRDRVAPQIYDISIVPRDAASHVEGQSRVRVFTKKTLEAQVEPIRIWGNIGFAVRSIDRAAPGPYRQAPYRYEVRVDGERLYRVINERFDYAHNHHIVLEYDQERIVREGKRSFYLFGKPGNRLAGRTPKSNGRGTLRAGLNSEGFKVEPGRHEVMIELADVAGNVTTQRFPIQVTALPSIQSLSLEKQPGGYWIRCRADDPDADPELKLTLRASWDDGRSWQPLQSQRQRGQWTATVPMPFESLGLGTGGAQGVVVHARVEDSSGLVAHRTVAARGAPDAEVAHLKPQDQDPHLTVQRQWRNDMLEINVKSAMPLLSPPRLTLNLGTVEKTLGPTAVAQTGPSSYRWVREVGHLGAACEAFVVEAHRVDGSSARIEQPMRFRLARPGQAQRITDLHPQCSLELTAKNLFEPTLIRMQDYDPKKLVLGPELRPAGACVAVESQSAPLNQRLRVALAPTKTSTEKTGLFYVDRSGNLKFLSATRNESGALVGKARYLTIFAELADSTPPRMRNFRKRGKRHQLQFRVTDDGAGLDESSIDVVIDRVFAIPEWDPETGEVIVHPFRDLASGSHEMRIAVVDRVGNRAQKTWHFDIP